MLTDDELARFRSKYEKLSNGCCRWLDTLDKDGYGTFYLRQRNRRAHRVAWFIVNGPIPADMVINHICRNPWCVNHQHLEAITKRENSLHDSNSVGAINARKTHCPYGHPYDKIVNTKSGMQRICSVCTREKQRRLRKKWREHDMLNGML